jgi:hypothetical protein
MTTAIDECAFSLDSCDANAVCTDTEENYTCACGSGFSGDGFSCASAFSVHNILLYPYMSYACQPVDSTEFIVAKYSITSV